MSATKNLPYSADQVHPWLFLGLTLGLTWALEFLAAGIQHVVGDGVVLALRYLAGLTPISVAAALTHFKGDRVFQRDFWKRLVDFRRIQPIWYLVIFGFVPLKAGLAALLDWLLGGNGIALEGAAQLLQDPALILPTVVFWLLFGPLPEEPGWRGYALEGLQSRRGPLVSSLVIGLIWALWHRPLFFIDSSWQAVEVGLLGGRFWLYMFNILLDSFVYTWIYNHTGRSILAAVLFHFSVNAFGEAFALSPRAEVFNFLLAALAAGLLAATWLRTSRLVES
jgi:membrane protease YdiL (CAAX protease family)